MSARPATVPARWTPYVQSIARIVFGFLVFRHGMEQVLAYPELSGAAMLSFEGFLKLLAFPGGLLVMLGLFTRPTCLVLSIMYVIFWFVGPLQASFVSPRGVWLGLFGPGGGSDPVLLNAVFFFYLAAAGAGAWSLDRLRHPEGDAAVDSRWSPDSAWAPHALAVGRMVAAFLFFQHSWGKLFAMTGPADVVTTLRGFGWFLEFAGSPLLLVGLFTRHVGFILSGMMAVAYFMNHAPRGFWESFAAPNREAAIVFCFFFLLLWTAGAGSWSLDSSRRRKRGAGRSEADVAVRQSTTAT